MTWTTDRSYYRVRHDGAVAKFDDHSPFARADRGRFAHPTTAGGARMWTVWAPNSDTETLPRWRFLYWHSKYPARFEGATEAMAACDRFYPDSDFFS